MSCTTHAWQLGKNLVQARERRAMCDMVMLTERACAAAGAQTLLLLFSVDDLTGFEITKLVELPDPWGIVVVWGLVLPLTYIISSSLTNIVLRDFLILKARSAPGHAALAPLLHHSHDQVLLDVVLWSSGHVHCCIGHAAAPLATGGYHALL